MRVRLRVIVRDGSDTRVLPLGPVRWLRGLTRSKWGSAGRWSLGAVARLTKRRGLRRGEETLVHIVLT